MIFPRQEFLEISRRLSGILGEAIPEFSPDVQAVADRAQQGIVSFYGSRHTPVGRSDIDWSAPQHTHQEWKAQLNRFGWLAALAAGYRTTRREEYAQAARDYIADWIRAHPAATGWTMPRYDCTLNVAIRLGVLDDGDNIGWLGALPALLSSPCFDDALAAAIAASAAAQLDYLAGHLCDFGNWRITHAVCLLRSGLVLTALPQAPAWRRLGVAILNDAFHRQILADGAHIERTPGIYHAWQTAVMAHLWKLSRAMPELGLTIATDGVARMLDYWLASTFPNGAASDVHDGHGPREGQHPNLALKARQEFRAATGLPDRLPPTSGLFPDAGQAFLRDSWANDAVHVTFDATTWGGPHCHLSRNSVQVHAYGRSLLLDPGLLTYEVSDPAAAYGKSTRAHNTLNLNGWNQSSDDPAGTVFRTAEGYDFASSRYTGGYWPGQHPGWYTAGHGLGVWAGHHRVMLWVRDACVVVLDAIACTTPDQTLESNWQLCPGRLALDGVARQVHTCFDDANVRLLFPLVHAGMTMSVHEGETDPRRGWIGTDRTGPGAAAPQVSLSGPIGRQVAELAAVIIPFRGSEPPAVTATAAGPLASGGVGELVLTWHDGRTDTVLWTHGIGTMIGPYRDIETDGALVHLRRDPAGRILKACAVDATYLAPLAPIVRDKPQMIVFQPGAAEARQHQGKHHDKTRCA